MMEEQLKNLKSIIENNIPDIKQKKQKNPKFLCVASGKGGVGKTNFSTNLAYILANYFDKKILIIDADIGLGNIHIILKIPLIKSLKEFFEGKDIKQNIIRIKNFDLIPGFSGIESLNDIENLDLDRLINSLEEIASDYDYIIIDTAAGIGKDVINFILASDKTYIITTPEPTAITDAYSLIKSLYKLYNYNNFSLIINMVKSLEEGEETFERLQKSCDKFLNLKLNFAGVLPYSENLKKSVLNMSLISENYPSDKFTKSLIEISKKEIGEEVLNSKKESFFKKLFSFLR